MIALALVILTSSSLAEAAPINNASVDNVSNEIQAEVLTDRQQIETPTAIEPVVEPVPAPEPTAPVVATVPQPKIHPIGCENYRELVSQYTWNVSVALAVIKAESSCNSHAIGDQYTIRGLYAPSCGLFQIRTLAGRPTCEQLQNPLTNIDWAWKLYQSSGWQPWSVCKNGKVACY